MTASTNRLCSAAYRTELTSISYVVYPTEQKWLSSAWGGGDLWLARLSLCARIAGDSISIRGLLIALLKVRAKWMIRGETGNNLHVVTAPPEKP